MMMICSGRLAKLHQKVPLTDVIARVKRHFNLKSVRLAYPSKFASQNDIFIQSLAVCAGSGGSMLKV